MSEFIAHNLECMRGFQERAQLKDCGCTVARSGKCDDTVQMNQKLPELDKNNTDGLEVPWTTHKCAWDQVCAIVE
jgi:hypothetical protein